MPRLRLALVLLAAAVATPAAAQVRASERGSVSQEVDGTVISVDYGRPQLRGRTAFPDVIKWGEMWTPGANWATTLTVNHPVTLDGHALKAGSYSLWMTPSETTWTLYVHAQAHRFHENRPKPDDRMVAVITKPATVAASVEALTFGFPAVSKSGATLEFRWGTAALAYRVDVEPTLPPGTMTEAQASAYVGDYSMIMFGSGRDSTVEPMHVKLVDGRLHGVGATPDMEFAIVETRAKKGVLYPAFLDKGEIQDVEVATPLTWTFKGRRAVSFTVAGSAAGGVWFKGVRK